MSKWAQRQRRINIPTAEAEAPPSAPVLTVEADDGSPWLKWAWGEEDPEAWRIDYCNDGVSWVGIQDLTGDVYDVHDYTKTCPGDDETAYYRVTRLDEDDEPILPSSNVVSIGVDV